MPLPEPKELRPIPLLDEEDRLPPLEKELELPKLLRPLLPLLNEERVAA